MKRSFLLMVCSVVVITAYCQQAKTISIIPEPVQLTQNSGEFILPKSITIKAENAADAGYAAAYLQRKLSTATGSNAVVSNGGKAAITLSINSTENSSIGKEGYTLSVTSKAVTIKANTAAGLFYGAQTFLQLLPKEIESNEAVNNVMWSAPCVDIMDYPRFAWRGLMLDVSRHFFTKDDVKKYIDEMAQYKYNLLHWHLTDDEGWRIEIKSYPKLTTVGAWNVKKVGNFGSFSPPTPDEPRNYGGFYTQEDIKEVIQYAKERFVNVMPEIEMPGHSLAAVASYPELSCTPGAQNYSVRSGEEIMDWSGPHFEAMIDNTLCPANDQVYTFIDKVMGEVAQLFPFEYIHVGGDECAKTFWKKSATVAALMKQENLKDMNQVQSYFEHRVEAIVMSKGKKMIGWDEILEGGLSPNASVMSWRGTKGGIEASKLGHDVVMSPTTFAYIDFMQADEIMEPHVYATLRLSKSYSYEPISEGIDAKYVKGLQANLWTEQIYNMRQVEYMTWPRAFAISEVAWSPAEKKNWTSFVGKVEDHMKRFDAGEIKYCKGMYDPDFKVEKNAKSELVVSLNTEISGLDVYYSFDNSYPDRFYPKYTGPVTVPKDASLMRVITYRGKDVVGRMNNMPVQTLWRRVNNRD